LFTGATLTLAQTTRPALQQLSDESHQLYEQVRHQVVRVETPVPQWMIELAERENPMVKWGQILDSKVRQQLMNQPRQPRVLQAEVAPGNEPMTASSMPTTSAPHVEIGPGANREAEGMVPMVRVTAKVNTMGLILDDKGRVLIPIYLDKEAAKSGPITIYSPDGVCQAKFVGSDPKSNLTVVQMVKIVGKPADLDTHRPDAGSLVMIVTPNQSAAQLVVWTGANPEFGVVSNMEGKIEGIERMGHLLSTESFETITRQLIQGGAVKRAILGVRIAEVRPDDPQRQALSELGSRPAIAVTEVLQNSAAAKAGIHRGDLILQLAGEDIDDPLSFATAIADRSGPTDLQILRDGKVIQTQVVLQPR
jgi:hypothetical protein